MTPDGKPRTGEVNGRLWGARARDWADLQEIQARPAYEAALERLGVGSGCFYLDAGCGAGLAVQLATRREARVAGADASEALLAIARERAPEAELHRGDLEALPFGDGLFDVITGFNSFQYASDPKAALAEAKRVSKPGGKVLIMTWGKPEGMPAASLVAALRPLLPPPPPGAPGPFALSDETALRRLAETSGLEPLEVFDTESPFRYPDLETGVRALGSAGVAVKAVETSGQAAVDAAHATALSPFRKPDGRYEIAATFRSLIARA